MTCDDEIDRKLLSRDIDAYEPFLDPRKEIGLAEIERAMEELELTDEEVKRRYEALAARFQLKLAWQLDNTILDTNGDLK